MYKRPPWNPGTVAELAATQKEAKYSVLSDTHIFQPLAFESHGPQNISTTYSLKIWDTELRSGQLMIVRSIFSSNSLV